MNNNIIVTGDRTGLGEAIYNRLGGTFVNRHTGHNLVNDSIKWLVAEESLVYDVFINAESLPGFHQTMLLDIVWRNWMDARKTGTIISMAADHPVGYGSEWRWEVERRAMRDLSERLDAAGDIRVIWFDRAGEDDATVADRLHRILKSGQA